jgi:hypothetical protein
MTQTLHVGDRVQWNSAGKTVRGKVLRKLTESCDIEGHHVAASKDNPEYLVESEASGKLAAHRPEALKKLND